MSGINDTTRYSVFIGQIVANGFHYKVDMNLEAGWQICVKWMEFHTWNLRLLYRSKYQYLFNPITSLYRCYCIAKGQIMYRYIECFILEWISLLSWYWQNQHDDYSLIGHEVLYLNIHLYTWFCPKCIGKSRQSVTHVTNNR